MQLFWGSYGFPVNAAAVTSQYTLVTAEWGRTPLKYDGLFHVEATIDGSGDVDLSRKELALREILATPNQDFILKTNSGANSSHAILARNSMSGTRVKNFAFNEAIGAEFVNRRTVTFDVEFSLKCRGADSAIVSWTEAVTIIGTGGPRREWRFPLNATAAREIVSLQSLVRAQQVGFAVGFTRRPVKPPMLWPGYEVYDARLIHVETPQFLGREYSNYAVRWGYSFERGDGPLIGVPNLPAGVA